MKYTLMGSVQFPTKIIRAQQEGNLVIFAGAGVSVAPPSCLPNFTELTKKIANKCGVKYTNEDPPEFLYKLEQRMKKKKRVLRKLLVIS